MYTLQNPSRSRSRRLVLLGAMLLALGLLSGRNGTAALAATITVSSCDEASLDSAISSASSGDTIAFTCGGSILLTHTITINKNLTLDGSASGTVFLNGQNSVQVLYVDTGISLTLNSVGVASGFVSCASNSCGFGGGLENNGGTVTIVNSTFLLNSASGGNPTAGFAECGAIANLGTLSVSSSTFLINRSPDKGGAICNDGPATVTGSTFANNSAGYAGAAIDNAGALGVSNSTFDRNGSGSSGAIVNDFDGTMTITSSTVADNSTFGVANYPQSIPSLSAPAIGGSIVANNAGGDCVGDITDRGYNLSSDSSCGFTASSDLPNTNPYLDPTGLRYNGGPTPTVALRFFSPAVDTIPAGGPNSLCPSTDQRGFPRPDHGEGACDMGAYEYSGLDLPLYLRSIVTEIYNLHLPPTLRRRLVHPLTIAARAINAGDTRHACGALDDFVRQVQDRTRDGRLTQRQAGELLAGARDAQGQLGCPS